MNAVNLPTQENHSALQIDRARSEPPQTVDLMAGAKAGDQSAVNLLLDRHRNSLEQLVRMRLDKKIHNRVGTSITQ